MVDLLRAIFYVRCPWCNWLDDTWDEKLVAWLYEHTSGRIRRGVDKLFISRYPYTVRAGNWIHRRWHPQVKL